MYKNIRYSFQTHLKWKLTIWRILWYIWKGSNLELSWWAKSIVDSRAKFPTPISTSRSTKQAIFKLDMMLQDRATCNHVLLILCNYLVVCSHLWIKFPLSQKRAKKISITFLTLIWHRKLKPLPSWGFIVHTAGYHHC